MVPDSIIDKILLYAIRECWSVHRSCNNTCIQTKIISHDHREISLPNHDRRRECAMRQSSFCRRGALAA